MIPLVHIAEPARLLLAWQSTDERSADRTRRVVGEVVRAAAGGLAFRYLKGTEDFDEARKNGFEGFPAFDLKVTEFRQGVGESLLRRLPPRSRSDFSNFLALHRLPFPFPGSDLALLGYTGGKLPSDGFAFVPEFDDSAVPCDYIAEVAGLRHVFKGDISAIHSGDPIELKKDLQNPIEEDAVEVLWSGVRVGFVNRVMRTTFCNWLDKRTVRATVERINGRPERPLLYVRVEVR